MSMNSVIEHRANSHFIKIQEDYLVLCKGDHCQALILDILEEWTNTKRKTKGQSLYIYMTYPQWITALYGAYGRNRIIKALADLEAQRLIEKRPYRLYGKETFEYRLDTQMIHTLISSLPEKKPDEVLPDLHAFKKGCVLKQTRLKKDGKTADAVPKRTGDAFKKGRNVESLTQNTNNINPEEAAISNFPSSQSEQTAAALNTFSFESLTEEEIALIQVYRQNTFQGSLQLSQNLGGSEAEQPSKQAERVIQADEQSGVEMVPAEVPAATIVSDGPAPLVRPAAVETAEEVVQLWEYVRQVRYGERERVAQLGAATVLLGMELPQPRTPELLETLYTTYYDKKWKELFGELHVAHLVGVEKSSGQVRIVRWINRLGIHSLPPPPSGKPSGTGGGEEPPKPRMDFANYPQEKRDPVQEYLDGTLDTSHYPAKMLEVLERHAVERRAVVAKGGNQ